MSLLKNLAVPGLADRRESWGVTRPFELLNDIINITEFYEGKITEAGARTAKDAMKAVSREIEADGIHGMKETREMEPPACV